MSAIASVAMASVMIPEEKLVRVLVIDDDDLFQERMSHYFALYGFEVDIAEDPNKAKQLLAQHEYQIVLADVNFPGLDLKGDRFVLKNYETFKGARVVVVTALNVNELRSRTALENLGIPVWSKGAEDWGQNLTGLTKETKIARKEEIVVELNDFLSRKLGTPGDYVVTGATAAVMAKAGPAPAPAWDVAVEDILIGWLEGISNRERPLFSIGRTMLSANGMIEEVKQKTEFGKELLEMFVTEIR